MLQAFGGIAIGLVIVYLTIIVTLWSYANLDEDRKISLFRSAIESTVNGWRSFRYLLSCVF